MVQPILLEIARKIRSLRQARGITLHEVAERAGVSKSLLSKVENARTVPSLPVLITVIQALEVDMNAFFEDIGQHPDRHQSYVHRRAADYEPFERENALGFSYQYILSQRASDVTLEAVMLELRPGSQREPLTTDGHEFKYLLQGEVTYRIGEEMVPLQGGDSLFFDGRIPHVPINNSDEVAKMLVVYLLNTTGEG